MKTRSSSIKPGPLALLLVCCSLLSYAQQNSNCSDWHIDFDASSAEAIILDPEAIVADFGKFWESDEAYKNVQWWHELRHQPADLERYKSRISNHCNRPVEIRNQHPALLLTRQLLIEGEEFKAKAIPHVCSFLPKRDMVLTSHIYFTAAVSQSGFAISDKEDYLVISVTDPYWEGSKTTIQNAMVHELFHTGYNQSLNHWRDADFPSETARNLLTKLHSEGLATYVAYQAASIFPAPAEKDFRLLNDISEVKSRLRKLNRLFRIAQSLSSDQLRGESWKVGVEQRGYYVVGAFMAKTIDEKGGRDLLIETLTKGSGFFIQSYNRLTDNRLRVFDFSK